MVAIRPFRALRYNPELVGDLGQVISPPYDVIAPEQQEQLYQRSPYNIVRLILGKQHPTDTSQDNRYTRAQRDFDAWRANRILQSDPTPAFYLIEHTFRDAHGTHCRLGFLALLQLDDTTERVVYRHEQTLAPPKEDRRKLLEAVPANLEPIFCVYPDEGRALHALLETLRTQASPSAHAKLNGDEVRVSAITEPSLIEEVTHHLASVAVLIADGHHRFEVAYANRHRYGALMSYFVSMEDPALLMWPIHRVIQPPAAVNLQTLRTICALEGAPDLASVMDWLQEARDPGRFGYYDGRTLYRATMHQDQLAHWLMTSSVPLPIATLDVSILHGVILPHLEAHRAGGGMGEAGVVRYSADAASALQMAQGTADAHAWLLRPIPLPQVYAMAAQGLTLPPKSTYFYPKVPSGLAIHPLT